MKIEELPPPLLSEVVSRVVANNFQDLLQLQQCSHKLAMVCLEPHMLRLLSFKSLYEIQTGGTSDTYYLRCVFMQKCVDDGNLEAMFVSGVELFFLHQNRADGLSILTKGAYLQHTGCKFALAIALIYGNDADKVNGIQQLSNINTDITNKLIIKHRREQMISIVKRGWSNGLFHNIPACFEEDYGPPHHFRGAHRHITN
ncbi:F-box protein At1g67340-like [Cornus florida]|uniref:F-box protein At1g67340-like n=1 Tax=Cornus florida TaxID=4283 RepID=UPI00289F0EF8|nr:F-box protein At1g67340-like [Cornus florida]